MITAADTRWCSYRDAGLRFFSNLSFMKRVAAESETSVKPRIVNLLYDENFIEDVDSFIKTSDPVCQLVNQCQRKDCSIADSTELWLKLTVPRNFQNKLDARKKMVLNKYALAANFLHPTYNGKLQTDEQKEIVDEFFLDELPNDGLDDLAAFKQKAELFRTLFERNLTNPFTFWAMAANKFPFLAELARKLLKIPASSAQLERLFSTFSFVHSKRRNRLTGDRSKKLVFLYHTLKLKDSLNSSDF
jgi:hAT family C-terminal dimerisation region